ncbi:endoglucanase ii [Ophiostoma piceae UAMH 11346]|uniref:cellulase n=1 Tax=Ophiostoma piceae (strain UAMH 11346) TaxID=1262450 RepID=S3C379_OPHP1|nr:endoglucanase ii [Ophiostoma piceae UAMH 11346]
MFSVSSLLVLGLSAVAQAKVQFLGIAIAGGDIGCIIDGSCNLGQVEMPLSTLGGADGLGQMKHFVNDDGLNLFRLPTSWQYLINSEESASSVLDEGNAANYDQLVQACLSTGAYCMIDVHNFARFNGAVIGQGGPSDELFAGLWAALATKYAKEEKIIFEVTNEPHDLDIGLWVKTCQKVVTAIRKAGASSQMILLPGDNFDSAATLVSSGSADGLLSITNPDGSTDNLLLDIHKYLDVNNSGTLASCNTDNVGNFTALASYLREQGRQGLISETGASPQAQECFPAFCAQNTAINKNSDVFVGLVTWAAGSFGTDYVLTLTPTIDGNGNYVDNELMTECVLGPYGGSPSKTTKSATTAKKTSTAKPVASSSEPVSVSPSVSASSSSAKTSSSSSSSSSESACSSAYRRVSSSSAMSSGLPRSHCMRGPANPTSTPNAAGVVRAASNLAVAIAVGVALL